MLDGTFEGPDELMELLAMYLHLFGAASAKLVSFGADGAPWVWDRWDWVIQRVGLKKSQVTKTLDWCHGVHHISLALEHVVEDKDERQPLVQETAEVAQARRLVGGGPGVVAVGQGFAERP